MNFINTIDDLYNMLDKYTEGVEWNTFYTKRDKPAPFLKYNQLPDKCVVDFIKDHSIRNACEFGCGEGRNAIYSREATSQMSGGRLLSTDRSET